MADDVERCGHCNNPWPPATIAALRAENAALREALIGMCHQYLSVRNGKLHHDFMSAGEHAFDVLGWPDTGYPLPPDCLCDVDGCGESPSCGWPDKRTGRYRRACGKHYSEAMDAEKALATPQPPEGGA